MASPLLACHPRSDAFSCHLGIRVRSNVPRRTNFGLLFQGKERRLALTKATAEAATSQDVSTSLLRRAAKDKSVDSKELTLALLDLEKASKYTPKSSTEIAEWDSEALRRIGGDQSPGHMWRLIFTANGKVNPSQASGSYFPLKAVQRFDASVMEIENAAFLGPLGYLTFRGPFSFQNHLLWFTFHTLTLKLGPLPPFEFKITSEEESARRPGQGAVGRKDPFFKWFVVEDDVIAGRGRGGGTAFWAKYDGPYK